MFYWIFLAILIALTVIFGLPGAFMGIGMVTFGLGMIVGVLAVNLLPLVLSFLPVAVLPSSFKAGAVILSIALYAAYLFGPGFLAQRQAGAFIAELTKDDIALGNTTPTPRSFELRYATRQTTELCPTACEALLWSGDADWVRVVFGTGLVVTFTTDANGIVAATNTQDDAALVVTQKLQDKDALAQKSVGSWVLKPFEIETFELTQASSASRAIYRNTRVDLKIWYKITLIQPHLTGTISDSYDVTSSVVRGEAQTHLSILRSMGLAKVSRRPEAQSDGYASRERSLLTLALASDAPELPVAEQELIASYIIRTSRNGPPTADDLDLIERIIKDPRFDRRNKLYNILAMDPKLRARVLPWIFETLEQRGDFQSKHTGKAILLALRSVYTPQELAPFFDRYARFVEKNKPVSDELARILGRFDADPTLVFRAMISATKDGLQTARHGLCGVDTKWHPALSIELMRAFSEYIQNGGQLTTRVRYAAYVSSAYGHREQLITLLRDQEKADELFWEYVEKYERNPQDLYNKRNGPCLLRI